MKDALQKIEWSDFLEKEIFSQRGFESFESFWNLEESGTNVEYKDVNIHFDKKNGQKLSHLTCIKLEQNVKYFLKRSQGKRYLSLRQEFRSYKTVTKFGFKTAKLVAFSLNDDKKKGFLLIKNIGNAICFQDLCDGNLPPETVARYQTSEKEILAKLASNIIAYQRAGHFYQGLIPKHIFINLNNADIYIVDLERFVDKKYSFPLSRIPFIARYWHYQERKNLLKSISNLKSTSKELKKLLSKW